MIWRLIISTPSNLELCFHQIQAFFLHPFQNNAMTRYYRATIVFPNDPELQRQRGGDRKGQFSIRVNKQYRICFGWIDRYAVNVELTDYH